MAQTLAEAARARIAQRASELAMDRIYSAFDWENDPNDAEWNKLSEGIYDDVIEALRSALEADERESAVAEPAMKAPPPPFAPGPENNCKREGWTAYFEGRPRAGCPFPPARDDLWRGYEFGWDAALAHAGPLPPPPQRDAKP